NNFGIIGMAIALVATIWLSLSRAANPMLTLTLLIIALLIGAAIGLWRARVVEMTQMPELVAMLPSFVGVAAVLVGYTAHLEMAEAGEGNAVHAIEIFLGVFIGAVTFTGSIVASLKLAAKMKSAPLTLPGRHWMNLVA